MNGTDEELDAAEEIIELVDDEGAANLDDVAQDAVKAVEAVREARREEGVDEEVDDMGLPELELLRAQVAEAQERAARTLADFENYRKRNAREREEMLRFAASESLREFLDVVDNLERALSAGGSVDDLKMGVGMIHRQMIDLMRRSGVEPIAAVGEIFDPARHEAVSRQEDPDVEQATVATELQTGYSLHGRLLRPAKVTVAVPVTAPATEDGDEA